MSYLLCQVIKPSVVGGFENAALIARWAQRHGKMAVISAAFESGLSLSTYILFSSYLEVQNAVICREMNRELGPSIAHGLGTYKWLKEDVVTSPLGICQSRSSGCVEASVADAARHLQNFQINKNVIFGAYTGEQVHRYEFNVDTTDHSCFIRVHEIQRQIDVSYGTLWHSFCVFF